MTKRDEIRRKIASLRTAIEVLDDPTKRRQARQRLRALQAEAAAEDVREDVERAVWAGALLVLGVAVLAWLLGGG
jgi:hypothetical protein